MKLDEYDKYKSILEDSTNACVELKKYHNELKLKYGEQKANVLWDSFITIYTTT